MDCVIEDGRGGQLSGKGLAQKCVAEWEHILKTAGLATDRTARIAAYLVGVRLGPCMC